MERSKSPWLGARAQADPGLMTECQVQVRLAEPSAELRDQSLSQALAGART
jgi:hypothetical protein